MDLSSLIPMLKANGVKSFEGYGIKVSLHGPVHVISQSPVTAPISPTPQPEVPGQPEPTMDLPGTNDAMSYQSILNWSASPDPEEAPEIPLTGDAPLGEST